MTPPPRHMRLRSIRVDDQLWRQVVATVGTRGVSEAIRKELARLVAEGLKNRPDPATQLVPWAGLGIDPVTLTETDSGADALAYARNHRTGTKWALKSQPVHLSPDDLRTLRAEHPEAFPTPPRPRPTRPRGRPSDHQDHQDG